MTPLAPSVPILLDHAEFVIVNKPSEVTMHDAKNGIITILKQQLLLPKLYLVHRLDTGTSGCLLIAKTASAAKALGELFEKRHIEKYYIALIDKKPQKKQGTISGDMINRRSGQYALCKTKNNPAITQFQCFSVQPKMRAAVVKPITGKTHQIRVALKSISAPILGDKRYGGCCADRLYLHARQLKFVFNEQVINCLAPLTEGEHFTSQPFQHWLVNSTIPNHLKWP